MLRMILSEQAKPGRQRRMSTVQWDMYTGSGSYKEILMRTLHPAFLLRLAWDVLVSALPLRRERPTVTGPGDGALPSDGSLGKTYEPGAVILRQGDLNERMYVIQEGQVALLHQEKGEEVFVGVRSAGEVVGETAIFEREVQPSTVQALSQVRLLTVDKDSFLKRIHHDPSLAFRLFQLMSRRVRELSQEVTVLNQEIDRLTER